jgi:hypothetical protein
MEFDFEEGRDASDRYLLMLAKKERARDEPSWE